MRFFILILAFLMMPATVPSAFSADDIPQKNETVPFREDAGLITAEYYLATGKYTQAIQTLGNVIQRHPKNADAYVYRGYGYAALGENQKAAENYQKALTLSPSHLGAHRYLADIYLQKNDLPRAMEHLYAMQMVCGVTHCAEMDELESLINTYKKK